MGNTNQGGPGGAMVPGERAKHRRPSTSDPAGPLEFESPMGTARYSETTPPNSQAKFGRNLLESLHNDPPGLQSGVGPQEQYTRRYRAGSISLEVQPNTNNPNTAPIALPVC